MVDATYDEVFGAALALPPGMRAMLAEHLLKSLDAQQQDEVDTIWMQEAESRVQSIEQEDVTPIAAETKLLVRSTLKPNSQSQK